MVGEAGAPTLPLYPPLSLPERGLKAHFLASVSTPNPSRRVQDVGSMWSMCSNGVVKVSTNHKKQLQNSRNTVHFKYGRR